MATGNRLPPAIPLAQAEGLKNFDPRDYPCTFTANYNTNQDAISLGHIAVKSGYRGIVIDVQYTTKLAKVHLPFTDEHSSGRDAGIVPIDKISVSTLRKAGQYKVEMVDVDLDAVLYTRDLGMLGDSRLRNIVRTTFQSVIDNSRPLIKHGVSNGVIDFIRKKTPEHIARYFEESIGNTSAPLLRVLNTVDKFTRANILEGCVPITSKTTGDGIYLRSYDKKPDGQVKGPPKSSLYTGSSIHLNARQGGHEKRRLGDDVTFHYTYTRHAAPPKCRVFSFVKNSDYTQCFEHMVMCLLDTQTSKVKNFTSQALDDALQAPPAGNSNTSAIRESLSDQGEGALDDKIRAALLYRLYQQAKSKTKWPGGLSRDSFGGGTGLNTEAPVGGRVPDRIVFTKETFPGLVTQYRRTPLKVFKNVSSNSLHINFLQSGNDYFTVAIPAKTIPAGTSVTPCFEIMEGERPHPKQWARLPVVGPFEEWARTRQVGLRFEYEIEGEPRALYVQYQDVWEYYQTGGEELVGALRSFGMALAFRRYLENIQPVNAPSWAKDYARPIIHEIKLDWMSQKWLVRNVQATSIALREDGMENRKSRRDIHTEFLDAGFTEKELDHPFADGIFLTKDTSEKSRKSTRKRCDRCFIGNMDRIKWGGEWVPNPTAKRFEKCEKAENEETCKNCMQFGMPCGYTDNIRLLNLDDPACTRRREALGIPQIEGFKPFKIPAPRMHFPE